MQAHKYIAQIASMFIKTIMERKTKNQAASIQCCVNTASLEIQHLLTKIKQKNEQNNEKPRIFAVNAISYINSD